MENRAGAQRPLAYIIAPPGRLRESLLVLLRASEEIVVSGWADDGPTGLAALAGRPPCLVLIDAGLGDGGAWEVLARLQRRQPPFPCLLLARTREQAQRAHAGGAAAVLQAGLSGEAFHKALQSINLALLTQGPMAGPSVDETSPGAA
ncbi:MAG: hypothetical protein ACE5GO_08365 [Anaerolineales bacterium]